MNPKVRDSWWSWRTEDVKHFFEWPTRSLRLNLGLFVAIWLAGGVWFTWILISRPVDPEPLPLAALSSLLSVGLLLVLVWHTVRNWPPGELEVGQFDDTVMLAMMQEARITARHADRVSLHWFSLLVFVHGSIIGAWLWLSEHGLWETGLTAVARTLSSLLLFLFTATGFSVVSRAVRAANQEYTFVKRFARKEPWASFINEGRRTGLERAMDLLLSLGLLIVAYGWLVYFGFQMAALLSR